MTLFKRRTRHSAEINVNGVRVLFSYDEPVAVAIGRAVYLADAYRRTQATRDHVAQWLKDRNTEGGLTIRVVPDEAVSLAASGNLSKLPGADLAREQA